jgi:NAD(P)-dependent dehydrogenase (short-subunit alcohol dehydrogenase family)
VTGLEGRVAIVTGGARALGQAYCLALAAEGVRVVSADLADSGETLALIESDRGAESAQIVTDVTERESTAEMARFAVERFGRIDVLINNAAYYMDLRRGPWHEIPIEEWDRAFQVNVRGVWLCCLAVHPHMKERGYGKIINISTTALYRGVPNFLHYTSSKSALIGFTRSLAREVGPDGISVNAVAPGYVPRPELLEVSPPNEEMMAVQQPIFRRTQVAGDLVGTILFLSGPGSDFITGQTILVNGGSEFS